MKACRCLVYVVAQFAAWAGGKCHCSDKIAKQSSTREDTRQEVFLDAISSRPKPLLLFKSVEVLARNGGRVQKCQRGSDKQNTRHASPEIIAFYHINEIYLAITRRTINRFSRFSMNYQQAPHPAVRRAKNIPSGGSLPRFLM